VRVCDCLYYVYEFRHSLVMTEESKTGQRSILSFSLKPKAGRDKQNAAVEEAAACTSDGSGTDSSLSNDVSESSTSDELEFRDTTSQPKLREYPQTGGRRFRAEWYHNRPRLEYSKQKDAAFCFPCRLFTPSNADAAFISLGFRKYVDELVKLHHDGLERSLPTKLVTTTVQLDLIVADSVARPLLQNCKQFNGQYGCGFCLHEGTATDKRQGVVRTYPLKPSLPTLRTHAEMLEHAEAAESSGSDVYGVKGASLLYLIPDFDHVTGFYPEYTHSVLLGVVRQFVNLWSDSSSFDKEFSLRKQLPQINITVSMKPPSEIKHLPHSLLHGNSGKHLNGIHFYCFTLLQL